MGEDRPHEKEGLFGGQDGHERDESLYKKHGEHEGKTPGHHSNEGTRIGHGEHHRIPGERAAYKFPANKKEADCFCGTSKSGLYRVSGKSGAHQIGKK